MKLHLQMDFIYKVIIYGRTGRMTCNFTTWDEFRKEHGFDDIRPIRREWTAYAWPGGYPIYHITKDNGILCSKCANENLKLTLGDDPQWLIIHSEINYEDTDLQCDNCYKQIESAYGEEEAQL